MSDAPQLQFTGFGIANYRSFDEEGFFLEHLGKINVFIGKNNSGKSNILRAIRLLKKTNQPKMPQSGQSGLNLNGKIDSHNQKGSAPSVIVGFPLEDLVGEDQALVPILREALEATSLQTRWNSETGAVERTGGVDALDGKTLVRLHRGLTQSSFQGTPTREQVTSGIYRALLHRAVEALHFFDRLICIENFREIRQVTEAASDSETFNGYNVIARLRHMQHPTVGNDREQRVFDRIQDFVRDLLREPDLVMEVPPSEDAIILTLRNRLYLQSYGTGVHQLVILCAALAMHENYIVCIEEPEIHMHPELQRRFIRFIAEETNNRYFITTHSNVFLDLLPDVALYHVTHDGEKSKVTRVEATPAARNVLADLGYKASDLLQANCVIWVEGPSDRVYLNKWLSLIAPELIETVHYAVMYYGGKVLAHFTAVDDPEDDLVQVLRINRYAIFLMDRDAVKDGGKLNATKERILKELGEEQCWVTDGREIENYLRPELIDRYLTATCGQEVNIKFTSNSKLQNAITKATEDLDVAPVKHTKVEYARAFCELMNTTDLDALDLPKRLRKMVELIRKWNHLDAA